MQRACLCVCVGFKRQTQPRAHLSLLPVILTRAARVKNNTWRELVFRARFVGGGEKRKIRNTKRGVMYVGSAGRRVIAGGRVTRTILEDVGRREIFHGLSCGIRRG